MALVHAHTAEIGTILAGLHCRPADGDRQQQHGNRVARHNQRVK